ncbi:MAG: class I adenylate-forming enzyme family protein [Succinivibrio sp.]|nr:acyl--CoA ligase [Succinivibrio sp.]MDY5188364.1 class I adenylate-forming enzyme family protein [Succinivibrio sp.]
MENNTQISLSSFIRESDNDNQNLWCTDRCFNKCYTYLDFRYLLLCVSSILAKTELKKIAICTENSAFFSVFFFSCLLAHKTPVLLGNFTKLSLVEDIDKYDLVVTDKNLNDLPIKTFFIDYLSLDGLLKNAKDTFSTTELSNIKFDSDAKIVLYTSGSTGKSKAVTKTFKQMFDEAVTVASITSNLAGTPNLKAIATVPPYHMYGLTFRIFQCLYQKITIEVPICHYTEELQNFKGPLVLISSPAFLKHIDFSKESPNIVFAISAGSALPKDTATKYYQWSDIAITEIYGSTETNVMAYRFNRGLDELFTPFENISFYEQDDNFYLKSPFVLKGFKLDDKLCFDKEHKFKILGRTDKIAKIAEKRISLSLIEQLLKQDPKVLDVVAFVLEKKDRNFIALVVKVSLADQQDLVNKANKLQFVKNLKLLLKDHIPQIAMPRFVRIVTDIPQNSMGKNIISQLKELFND